MKKISNFQPPVPKVNGNGHASAAHLHAREVMELTGWSGRYLRKLRDMGVVRVFQPRKQLRPLYFRAQIEQMVK